MEKRKERVVRLSESQEMELVGGLDLLLVAIGFLNHWTFQDIVKFYTISEHTFIRSHGTALIIPMRPWVPDIFNSFKR